MLRRALLMYSDEQIVKMLKEPVDIDVNKDAEGVIRRKLDVQEMKDEILKYLEGGGTVQDAFEFYARQSAEERAFQRAARLEMRDIAKTGDQIALQEFVTRKNNELRQRGLQELRMPTACKNQVDKQPE